MNRARCAAASLLALPAIAIAQAGPALSSVEHVPPPGPLDAPFLLWTWVVFIGLCVGSFLNVVIHRLPIMERRAAVSWAQGYLADHDPGALSSTTAPDRSAPAAPDAEPFNLMVPRSACPQCGHQIAALENVPIVSWLALRGRCSACKTPISARYPVIEGLTAVLTVIAITAHGFTPAGVLAAFFTWALIALTMIDVDHMELPDAIVYPLLWLGLLANTAEVFVPLSHAVVGAAIGYGFLWSLYWAFRLLTGKEGMGYGDFKLMAAMGAWLGWASLPGLLLLSSLSGLIAFAALRVTGQLASDAPMPFGPAIALAGYLALILPALGIAVPGLP